MARYIDADKLLDDIQNYHLSEGMFQHWVEVQPTADVRENVRGEWIKDLFYLPTCSRCGGKAYGLHAFDAVLSDFCPHCGADMRGEKA